MPIKEVGDAKRYGKRERACSSSSIPEAAFLLCPLEKGVGDPQQYLYRRRRSGPTGARFED